MRTKRPSRSESHLPAPAAAPSWSGTPTAYRQYLLDRGNAAGYVRNCEAAVVHLVDVDGPGQQAPGRRRRGARGRVPRAPSSALQLRDACASPSQRARRTGPPSGRAARCRCHRARSRRTRPRWARNCAATTSTWTQVRGLAPKTREGALRLVEALLRKHFGDGAIRFDAITAEHVRRFFAAQAKLYKTPSSLGAVVSALRGYFRWRATLGDRTHALVGAAVLSGELAAGIVAQVAEPAEVEQLVGRPRPERPVDAARRRHGALRARSGPAQRRGRPLEPGRHRLGRRHDHAAPHQGPARRRDALA